LRNGDIHTVMNIFESEAKRLKMPVVTEFATRKRDPYQVLVSTILSLRTQDDTTREASLRLFKEAPTLEKLLKLEESTLQRLIYPVGFYPTKARRLLEISRILLDRYDGHVPDTLEALTALPGVGRKTANLVLVEGFKIPAICVDTHVHRISNRIGYVKTKNPDKTELALRKKLPKRHWVRYNELLVAFGQVLCRPVSPFCSRCPVSDMCPRIGVDRHR